MTNCKYPEPFKNLVKHLYDGNSEIDTMLEEGDTRIGSILNETLDISPTMIVTAIETAFSLEEREKLPDSLMGLYNRAIRQEQLDYVFGWFLELTAEIK